MLRAARATATIPVEDPQRAKAFYEGTLGLEVVFEGEGFVLLAAGEETSRTSGSRSAETRTTA